MAPAEGLQHRLHGRSSTPRVAAPLKIALEQSAGTMRATCARRITVPLRTAVDVGRTHEGHAASSGLAPVPEGPLLVATRQGARDERARGWLLAHMDGLRTPYLSDCAFLWMPSPVPTDEGHAAYR